MSGGGGERQRERQKLLEEGLFFAATNEDEDVDLIDRLRFQNRLGALLQELSHLQSRMALLMEKIGLLPIELIRDMREEVINVTDQLRDLNRLRNP